MRLTIFIILALILLSCGGKVEEKQTSASLAAIEQTETEQKSPSGSRRNMVRTRFRLHK